jgi:AhpC/TSA family
MRSVRTFMATAFIVGLAPLVAIGGSRDARVSDVAQRTSAGEILDVTGHPLNPFEPAGVANVLFFIATDCPISNSYAPEIQSICRDYAGRGIECSLMYEDVDLAASSRQLDESVRKHLQEYGYTRIPAVVDRARTIAKRAKASVTPQAVVVDRTGKIRYRGRIDNFYAALGKTRRQVTEHDLRAALDAVLSGAVVPKSETEALGCFIVDPAVLRK